ASSSAAYWPTLAASVLGSPNHPHSPDQNVVWYLSASRCASSNSPGMVKRSTPKERSAVIDPAYRWGANTSWGSVLKPGAGDAPIGAADHVSIGSTKARWAKPWGTDRSAARMASMAAA